MNDDRIFGLLKHEICLSEEERKTMKIKKIVTPLG